MWYEARDKGEAVMKSLFHRRREIPDINSPSISMSRICRDRQQSIRLFGGSAAILKIAMIRAGSSSDR